MTNSWNRTTLRRSAAGWWISAGLIGLWGGLTGCSTAPPATRPDTLPARLTPEQSKEVTVYAIGLVGTPYRWGGNTPESGFDCSGLIAHVYQKSAKLRAPRTVAELKSWGTPMPLNEIRTGDLILFSKGNESSHAGIYVGDGRFVHAPSTGGRVRLDRFSSGYWSNYKVAFNRP